MAHRAAEKIAGSLAADAIPRAAAGGSPEHRVRLDRVTAGARLEILNSGEDGRTRDSMSRPLSPPRVVTFGAGTFWKLNGTFEPPPCIERAVSLRPAWNTLPPARTARR